MREQFLKTISKSQYRAYMQSKAWQAVRKRFFQSDLPKCCYACKTAWQPGFHLHHRTYANLGNEKLTDLVIVCQTCHDGIHKQQRATGESIWTATEYYREQLVKMPRGPDVYVPEPVVMSAAEKAVAEQKARNARAEAAVAKRIVVTAADIDRAQLGNGTWSLDQLADWGIQTPASKGWRKRLIEQGEAVVRSRKILARIAEGERAGAKPVYYAGQNGNRPKKRRVSIVPCDVEVRKISSPFAHREKRRQGSV